MITGDNQNPWATPSGGNAAFLNPNRPAIADLALAALKEKGETKKKKIWFTFPSFNQDRSLFFLTRKNPIRRHCLNIVDSKPFDIFILLSILANCTALSINHPYPDNDSNNLNEILDKVEKAFVFIFLTESVLKIIAYGFIFHPNAYLKSFWNILDFSIVIIGVLSTILEDTNIDVKSLRAFRILRPLRLVSSLPSLQVVLNSILTALIPLLHIGLLVIFVIILYSIIGIELFNGKLHKTCYRNVSNRWIMMDDPIVCTDANSSFAGFSCKIVGPEYVCKDLNKINRWPGPNNGITSFDNFFYAMLTVFVCITMEGWTDVGYWISNAEGSVYPWVYFVSLILIGSFFVMNLVLGVLSGEFSKEKEKIDRKELFRKERQEKREQQDYIGYKEWIEIAEEISDSDDESYSSSSMESNRIEDEAFSHIEEVAKTRCHSTLKKLRKFRKRTRRIVIAFLNSRQCFILIIVLVFLNTVVLTTEHHGQPEWLDRFQTFANNIFVSLFTVEMIIKMNAFGFQDYFSKMFNRFDFIIVICSVTEMLFTKTEILPAMGISVLRCARLLRIFKLTHYWEALRSLVSKLLKSVHSIASLLLLLFLFILIFSLLGMQTFGGKFNFKDKEKPRANFDGVVQAMLTVFQILTGEDWNAVMYDGMKAYENEKVWWSFMVVLYFVILFICGNYILLNVFLAIAVDNLNDENDDEEEEERKAKEAANADADGEGGENGEEEKNPMRHIKPKTTGADYTNFTEMTYEEMFAEDEDELNAELKANAAAENAPQDSKVIPPYTSFFIFRDDNKFRVFCHNIICSSYFGNIILACILVSSILLAAEDPVNSNSSRNRILNYFDYFFTTVFTIEITLKVISYGLILHEGAFCRSLFNLLDLIVVCVALVSFLLDKSSISVVKILRVLRVLRPLRAINRAKGLKRVVQCVIVAVKSIGNIMLVTFLLMFMFAVMGVQLFKGRFSYCNDRSKRTQEECQGYFINYEGELEKVARVWKNNDFHFDNVGQALLSLFATSTFEGWPDLLWLAIDSNKENFGPLTNYRKIVSLFFIIYIIIIAFFMVNIFVGFVIVTFQREGEAEYKYIELDKNQRKCIEYALKARPRRRYIPKGHLQYRIWSIVVSKKFEYFIFGAILINTFMMCLRHDNASQTVVDIMDYTNYIFTVIFTLEFILKLSAFSIRHYFGDPLNVLDFILVIGSLVDIVIMLVQGADDTFARLDPKYYRFFRLLRVMRLIKLLNKEESIRKLLWTFVKSIQALPYVALLIAMIFFIYAVIGMQLFGKIEMKPDNDEDAVITRSNNFSSFLWALLVLFRSSTGESWQKIMMACKADQKCGPENRGDTCGSNIAFVYFTSFYFLCSFLIINLFVAVIMDNFDYLTRDWSILGPHHLDEFVTKWAEYDPEAKGRVKHIEVGTMLGKINPPLGFGSMCPHTRACHKLVRMNMPLQSDGTVFFNATLFALVRRNLKIKVPDDGKDKDKSLDQLNEELRAVIRRIWKRTSPKLLDQIIPPKDSDVVTVGKFYATFLIQNWFRDWQKRKMVRKDTRYIPQILAGDRSMPHQPTIGGLPRKCSSDLTGDELKRGFGKRETPSGIIGRTLSEWTRRQSHKNHSSNRRELTDPFYKSGQQNIEPVTLNVPTNLHVAHPSVMAVAQNQTAKKTNENQKPDKNQNKEETNDPSSMNGIMNFLWGNQSKQNQPDSTDPSKTDNSEELNMARMMFAAARRESKKYQNMI